MKYEWSNIIVQVLQMVDDHKTLDEISKAVKVGKQVLQNKLQSMRKTDKSIPKLYNEVPEGTTRQKTIKGIIYQYVKQDKKWISQGRIGGRPLQSPGIPVGTKVVRKPYKRVVKTKLQEYKEQVAIRRAEREKVKQQKEIEKARRDALKKKPVYKVLKQKVVPIPTKKVDQSMMKTVRISPTLLIQIPKSVPDAEGIANYWKKREECNSYDPRSRSKSHKENKPHV